MVTPTIRFEVKANPVIADTESDLLFDRILRLKKGGEADLSRFRSIIRCRIEDQSIDMLGSEFQQIIDMHGITIHGVPDEHEVIKNIKVDPPTQDLVFGRTILEPVRDIYAEGITLVDDCGFKLGYHDFTKKYGSSQFLAWCDTLKVTYTIGNIGRLITAIEKGQKFNVDFGGQNINHHTTCERIDIKKYLELNKK